MKRSALSDFLRSVVVAALPLAAGCCKDEPDDIRQVATDPFDAGVDDAGALAYPVCTTFCGDVPRESIKSCYVSATNDAGIIGLTCVHGVMQCVHFAPGGRPPLGLVPARAVDGDEVARFFAKMAHVEAAAVDGFRELADALSAHGAPSPLVASARHAAEDERRHARVATALARRRGVEPPPVEIAPVDAPSLETLALANAREGCVLETWGAVVTEWQGRTAADGLVRRSFANIARDELRHAELARAVADWLASRLDDAARRRIRAARDAAIAELARTIEAPLPRRLVVEVGLPDRDAARAMLATMRARLWT